MSKSKGSSQKLKTITNLINSGRNKHFNKDFEKYQRLFSNSMMEEYQEIDPKEFKRDLRNNCPVIHDALWSISERLKEWKEKFTAADSQELLDILSNSLDFAYDYSIKTDLDDYQSYDSVDDFMNLKEYSMEEDFFMPGVIGAGIKSTIIYYLYPALFNRSVKTTLYAMFFLTDEEAFGLPSRTNEFIMIDDTKEYKKRRGSESNFLIDQNYWYPYFLFMYYSKYLYDKFKELSNSEATYELDPDYRYVDLFTFLDFVCQVNSDKIRTMTGGDQELDKNQI